MVTKLFIHLECCEGQSVVEYILLLAVVATLSLGIFKSDAFQDFLGPDSEFFNQLAKQQEYAYRHGLSADVEDDSSVDSPTHHTYKNNDTGLTRFYGQTDPYPQ